MVVLLNQAECFVYFALGKTGVLGKFNGGLKPELGLAALALNVHMHPGFFPREEVETEAAFAKNRWTHVQDDTRNTCSGKRRQKPGLIVSPLVVRLSAFVVRRPGERPSSSADSKYLSFGSALLAVLIP
jgi:hypothetical protein